MPEPDELAPQSDGGVTARPERRPLADVGAATLLGAVLLWLPALSGGRTPLGVAGVGLIALVAAPAAFHGLRGASSVERVLLGVLGVALLVHPFVAGYRDGIDEPLMRYSVVPLIYLTARYAVARWPGLLASGFPVAGLWIWWQGWAGWMDPPDTLFAAWRVVPWHNPSGILLGSLVVYSLTMMLAGRRRGLHAGVAALCASGLWLSASRASIAMTVLAVLVVLAVGLRDRRAAAWLAGVSLAAGLVTVGLLAISPSYGAGGQAVIEGTDEVATGVDDPFGARGGAGGNARARILHVQAALRMFERDPFTGAGLGSYDHSILEVAEPRMNYTRSAHSEPAEVLGEGGLLVGVPFAALTVAAIVVLLPFVVRGSVPAGRRAAAGAAVLIVAHTLFDVDWGYLLVVGFAAIAAGGARPASVGGETARTAGIVTVVALVMPLTLGLVLTVQRSIAQENERGGWWEAEPRIDVAVDALATGQLDVAAQAARQARAAAPGDGTTAGLIEIVALAASGDAEGLYAVATDPITPLGITRFAIAALVEIDHARAVDAVAVLDARLAAYHAERVVVLHEELDRLVAVDADQLSSAS